MKIGELIIDTILRTGKSKSQVRGLERDVNQSAKSSVSALDRMSAGFGRVYLAAEGVQTIFNLFSRSVNSLANAHDSLIASQREMSGTAKITGQSLEFMQEQSDRLEKNMGIAEETAIRVTIEMIKLTGQAGALEQTGTAMESLLDIAAARGMDSSMAMQSLKQAILGVDEGTDRLFNANPSVIYKDWAKQAGIAAGKMTDLQKKQALLDRILQDGAKVRGEYQNYLLSEQGLKEQNRIATQRLRQEMGALINQGYARILPMMTSFVRSLSEAPDAMQGLILAGGGVTTMMIGMQMTGIMPMVQKGIPRLISSLTRLGVTWKTAAVAGGGLALYITAVATLLKYLDGLKLKTAGLTEEQEKLLAVEMGKDVSESFKRQVESMNLETMQKTYDEMPNKIKEIKKEIKELNHEALKEMEQRTGRQMPPGTNAMAPGVFDLENKIRQLTAQSKFLKSKIDIAQQVADNLKNTSDQAAASTKKLSAQAQQEFNALQELAGMGLNEIDDLMQELQSQIDYFAELAQAPGTLSKETVKLINTEMDVLNAKLDVVSRRYGDLLSKAWESQSMMQMQNMTANAGGAQGYMQYTGPDPDRMLDARLEKTRQVNLQIQDTMRQTGAMFASTLMTAERDWDRFLQSLLQMVLQKGISLLLNRLLDPTGMGVFAVNAVAGAASGGGGNVAAAGAGGTSNAGINVVVEGSLPGQEFTQKTIVPGTSGFNRRKF